MTVETIQTNAVVFDLDGTLVDTTPQVIKFWTELAKENNIDPAQVLATSHGRRTIETLERWMPHLATVEHVMALEEKLASDKEGVVLLPGVMDLLNKIDPDDWTICTAGTFPMAIGRLNQFGIKAPPKMVTGDKLSFGKPHPEGYLLAAHYLNRDPKACVVFEDAPAGVQAAIAAGMTCIACTTTHTYEQLKEAGATFIVERLDRVHIEKSKEGHYTITIQ
ncbi:Sugar phosphatase YfbT [Choanephora cucurbitarum]|uniref:Sugar phosphatase YfbT n=1 Tax=Choanephora cucurbitarum TaxID=101091 RepID=A0A1C7MY57_9FUNG|nr:Sugar phosphatase YfbT [Choanephora cucurbitarum]